MVATKGLHRGIGGASLGFGSQSDAAWPQRNVSSLVRFQGRRGAVAICVIKSEHAPVAPGTHVENAARDQSNRWRRRCTRGLESAFQLKQSMSAATSTAAALAAATMSAAALAAAGRRINRGRRSCGRALGERAQPPTKRRIYPGRLAELETAYRAGRRPRPGVVQVGLH